MQSLGQEIVRSYEDRVAGIAQLRETVKSELKQFQDSRTAMSKELRADLAKVRSALMKEDGKRRSQAREFRRELTGAVAEGKAAVKARLGKFRSAHKAMSREMRTELARGRQALADGEKKRQTGARQFKGELAKVVAEGKAATQARLKELAGIQAGGRDEWQKLTATMQAKRGAPVAVAPPPTEEEALARAEVAEVTPEMAKLRDRVFSYLADHPDGTRMTELAGEFGLARIQMARVIRSLIDENKVEKRDLLYFAI
jgi:hypothetical protein